MKSWISAVVLLLAGVVALVWYLWSAEPDAAPASDWKVPPPTVEAGPVIIGSVIRSVEAVGTLLANEAIILRPEISGRVVAIEFSEGQPVEAALQLAKARLDKTRIMAPFAGTMGLRHVSPGDYVAQGQDLVSLVEINPLKVEPC